MLFFFFYKGHQREYQKAKNNIHKVMRGRSRYGNGSASGEALYRRYFGEISGPQVRIFGQTMRSSFEINALRI